MPDEKIGVQQGKELTTLPHRAMLQSSIPLTRCPPTLMPNVKLDCSSENLNLDNKPNVKKLDPVFSS